MTVVVNLRAQTICCRSGKSERNPLKSYDRTTSDGWLAMFLNSVRSTLLPTPTETIVISSFFKRAAS